MTNGLVSTQQSVIREILTRRDARPNGNPPPPRSSESVKLGLVVEGGGMRGVYSGGALVAMEQLGLTDVFDEVYGESAGAINACYFLARQGSYGINIYLDDLTSLKFANPCRVGTILDLDYAIDTVVKTIKPLDTLRVLASPSKLYIAVTHAVTGQSRIIDVKGEGVPLLTLLKATGAIVPLYNHSVQIEGEPYVDGGIANPVPVESAIRAGCTHILVLLTRPPDFNSAGYNRVQRFCLSPLLRKWPASFIETFYRRQASRYNDTRDVAFGRKVVKEGVKIAVIAPGPDSPTLSRATIARKKLLAAKDDAFRRTLQMFEGVPAAASA
jgi:predicted patatin/cPLA2 family phospholipase